MNFRILISATFFLFFSACASFQKVTDKLKGRNKIVGPGAEDIENRTSPSQRDSDSGTVSGLSTVFFALDSSELSDSVKAVLDLNIQWLKNNPEAQQMELEGHCDSLGSEAYNIGLGRRRANSVKMYLKDRGIPEDKLKIISYGEERPLSDTDNSKNRRVNFVPIY